MVAKLVVEFLIPAVILLWLLWMGLKWWYLRYFPRIVRNHNKLNAASAKYDSQLKPKVKKSKPRTYKPRNRGAIDSIDDQIIDDIKAQHNDNQSAIQAGDTTGDTNPSSDERPRNPDDL